MEKEMVKMEPGSGISGYSARIGMEPGLGIGEYSTGVDLKAQKRAVFTKVGKAVANQLVESGASIAGDVMMGNDIRESMQREVQNARQNAAMGIQKKKGGGYSKFKKLCITKSDYSKFKDLCILKYARDYVKEHNDLVENVQKYFKKSYCKELAIEMMKKTTAAFEKKYGKNVSRSNMKFL